MYQQLLYKAVLMLFKEVEKMSVELDRLNASVSAIGTSVDSAVQKIDELKKTGVDPAALTPIADAIDAAKAKLDAALV